MLISRSGSPGTPSNVADHFAPRIIVGNTPAGDPAIDQATPFQYIHDTGDGAGIAAALAAAVSGYDVYIRPGTYDFGAGAVATPLTIPAGVRVCGAPAGPNGLSGTILVARSGDATHTQDLFTLGIAAALESVQIRVPVMTQGTLAGGIAIIRIPNIAIRISRVYIDMTFGGNGQRATDFAIGTGRAGSAAAPCTGDVIEDVEILLPTLASTVLIYAGIACGFPGTDSIVANVRGPTVRRCRVAGGQVGVAMFNINEPVITDFVADGLILSAAGSNGIIHLADTAAALTAIGPKIIGPRIFVSTTGDAANTSAAGIAIECGTTQTATELRGTVISDYQIIFQEAVGLVGARQGIKIRIEPGGIGQNNRGAIGPGVITGAQISFLTQSATTSNTNDGVGSINDWTVTGLEGRGFATFGAFVGVGAQLDIVTVPLQPKINRISLVGCNFSGAPAGTTGVIINSVGVINTCVCGNQLTPGAGTNILDNGVGSQITGNVP